MINLIVIMTGVVKIYSTGKNKLFSYLFSKKQIKI